LEEGNVTIMGAKLTAAVILLAGVASTPAMADGRWYLAHLRQEVCVPIDDIGNNSERLYYGAGAMHTPEDFVRRLRSAGTTVRLMQIITAPNGSHTTSMRSGTGHIERTCSCSTTLRPAEQ
jgi:predicted nucleotidyltransferase